MIILVTAGCGNGGPVGSGEGPTRLVVLAGDAFTQSIGDGAVRVPQCATGSLHAYLYFSNGSVGDYTKRVNWTSLDPGAVSVSNGELLEPDGVTHYPAGTLIAHSAGATNVRASFSKFQVETSVSVATASGFQMKALVHQLPAPVSDFTMGSETTEQFSLSAVFDQVSRDISSFVQWQAPGPNVVAVNSTGLVTAHASGEGSLNAHLPICDADISIPIHVANITGISSALEFGSAPLILGNSEHVRVTATLDNGNTQDISTQATITAVTPEIVSMNLGSASDITSASAIGTGIIRTNFLSLYQAPDIFVTVVEASLAQISVSPETAIIRAGSDEKVPFTATGTFDNGQVQDVTRMVSWSVLNAALGQVSNTIATKGVVSSAGSLTGVGQTSVLATPATLTGAEDAIGKQITFDSATSPATAP